MITVTTSRCHSRWKVINHCFHWSVDSERGHLFYLEGDHFGGSGQWLKRKINTDHLLSKHLNNDKCPNIVKLITQYLNVLTIAKSRRLLQCRQFYMKNIPDCISLLSLLNHICIEKFKIFIFLLCHILKRIFYILLWFESQHENPHYIMGILLIWPPFPSLYNTFLGTQYG